MAQIFMKLLDWVASEVIVKKLAHSKSFQQFALKTESAMNASSKKVENISKEALEKISKTGEEVIQKNPKKLDVDLSGIQRFAKIFADEVKKDFKIKK